MAPKIKRPPQCQICSEQDFKYTCPQCRILYCSLGCYKKHKETSCLTKTGVDAGTSQGTSAQIQAGITSNIDSSEELSLAEPVTLRPLTTLNWPYVPDESAFPDPLKRDDPKVLNLSQYEAVATSQTIRTILSSNKNIPDLLTSIDKLRGPDREYALQRALGITAPEIDAPLRPSELGEDVLVFRELAEAVEAAVRGGNNSALGLNWGV